MAYIKKIIAVLLLLLGSSASAQKVGLVLSGGGAKGLYHIGVLKALEENGIPVDYVSGTSMGSIIAGLYAIGYSPDEMAEVFKSGQVQRWMSGRIDNKYLFYFKQKRPNAAMITLHLDFKNPQRITRLPTNLIPSHQIDMAFVDFFSSANARCGGDFDNLFVPFRCVATDAASRKEVVYRSGDLGKAIRASMTIPLVFKPLKQDSTLLYDGGLYNNFPWQVLEEDFHPDILIGSKCVAGNSKPDEDNVMEQIFALTMRDTDYQLPDSADVLIEHAFDDVSTLDFSKADYVINRGYADAVAAMPMIRERIARRESAEDLYKRRIEFRASQPPLLFDGYRINGLNEQQTEYVERMLNLNPLLKKEKEFDLEAFRSEYFKLLSEGDIEGGYPNVVYNDSTGRFHLDVDMKIKSRFRVMFGGNISSTSMNQAYVGAEYRTIGRSMNTYNLDGYFSALYTSVGVNGRTDFFLRRPFAVDYGYNFNYYNYFRSNVGYITKTTDLTYSKYSDSYFTGGLSLPTDRFSVLSLPVHAGREGYRYYQPSNSTDRHTTAHTCFPFFGVKLDLDRSVMNYLIYPTRGLRQSISAIYIRGEEKFVPGTPLTTSPQQRSNDKRWWFGVKFSREQYFPIAKWFSLGYLAEGVYTNHPRFSNEYATNISSPAFMPTPHSRLVYLKEFRSDSYLGVGLMPTFEFGPKFYLKNSFYAFLPGDNNSVKENIHKRVRYMFNSSLVYQTPIGTVSLALSKYDVSSNNNWFLTFNFGYTIFNRSGVFY